VGRGYASRQFGAKFGDHRMNAMGFDFGFVVLDERSLGFASFLLRLL
jgi:hypothetical protein